MDICYLCKTVSEPDQPKQTYDNGAYTCAACNNIFAKETYQKKLFTCAKCGKQF